MIGMPSSFDITACGPARSALPCECRPHWPLLTERQRRLLDKLREKSNSGSVSEIPWGEWAGKKSCQINELRLILGEHLPAEAPLLFRDRHPKGWCRTCGRDIVEGR